MDTPALEDRTKNFNLEVSELDPRGWAGFEIFLTTSCCFACLGLACALSMAAAALFTSAREFTAQDCYARQCLVTKTTLLGLGKKSSTDAPCCNMISLLCELLLQLQPSLGWHESSLGWWVLLLELVRHFFHCHKLDTFVFQEVFDQPTI
jgi:hypothetical protein